LLNATSPRARRGSIMAPQHPPPEPPLVPVLPVCDCAAIAQLDAESKHESTHDCVLHPLLHDRYWEPQIDPGATHWSNG
jgi:hypothetical protein